MRNLFIAHGFNHFNMRIQITEVQGLYALAVAANDVMMVMS